MEDNPYIVKLKPDEFHELYDEYTTFVEWSQKHMDARQRELAERVLEALHQADVEHVCVDLGEHHKKKKKKTILNKKV